jgi:bifunctional isochorismate lyase / aryl carrier protein
MVLKESYFTETTVTSVAGEMLAEVSRLEDIHPGKIQPQSYALLVIDMQRHFLDGQMVPSAPAIIPNINRLIQAFHRANRPVIFTRHLNRKEDAGMMEHWWDGLISPDDPNSMLDERVNLGSSVVINKTQYGAFYKTELEEMLRKDGVTQVVVCGVVTHLCCETTARCAFLRGFSVVFPPDATASYNRQLHLASLLTLCNGFIYPLMVEDFITGLKAL